MAMWLDRGIGWAFPGWGLQRARARAALTVMQRAYEGARVTRRTSRWNAASTSANAEIAPALSTLRNRSRDQVRNNPYAKRAIAKLVSASIGTGVMARPPAPTQKVWEKWCRQADFEGQLDFYGLQSLIGRTVFESGECLVRRIREGGNYAGEVPLRIQVLEPDYIDSTRIGPQSNGNYAIAGIELDRTGRRVGYWLWDQHPGEMLTMPLQGLQSRRVDASEILHIYEKERPGQLRGVPRLAVSLMKMRDLDEYEEAELVRKKIEACFAAFVTTSSSGRTVAESATSTDSSTGEVTRTETLSPGMIEYLQPGEEINFGAPRGQGGYGDYTATQLHAIAAGAGVTYEQLTGDFSRVNYSSARAGMLEFRELIEIFRWIYFVPMACQPIFDWFVDAAYTAGRLRTDGYDNVVWTPPRWQYVDPVKDALGDKLETISGFKTLSSLLRERGMDPDQVFQEYADERAKLKKLDLTFDSSAVVPSKNGDSGSDGGTPKPAPKDGVDDTTEEDRVAEAMSELAAAIAAQPAPVVNVPVTIGKDAVSVTVNTPEVRSEFKLEPKIDVNVPAAVVHVAAAAPGATVQTIERDVDGEMTRVVTRPLQE